MDSGAFWGTAGPRTQQDADGADADPIDPVVEARADRKQEALERRQIFDRVHKEAGRRLRALRRKAEG